MNSASSLPMGQARAWTLPQVNTRRQRWLVVVFYMRFHIDRLVPYRPEPLPLAGGFRFAEAIRELATRIMLATRRRLRAAEAHSAHVRSNVFTHRPVQAP